jgi:hypothetical protein
MIPDLDTGGNLPPGIHQATWTEIVTRYATSYGGELYPAHWPASSEGIPFRDYFQRERVTKQPKGIVAIDLSGLP